MISKPLFRVGDKIAVRHDVRRGRRYFMMHRNAQGDVVTSEMLRARGHLICVEQYGRESVDEYNIQGFSQFWTDAMFVEGYRIMQWMTIGLEESARD